MGFENADPICLFQEKGLVADSGKRGDKRWGTTDGGLF